MAIDHAWISDEVINKFDAIYTDAIVATNATLDEQGEEVDEIYGWDEATTFKEFLYLDYKFVTGALYGSYTHYGPLVTEHSEAVGGDLTYLVKHGVYTYHGQEPQKGSHRSLLDFVVMVRDDIVFEFMALLKQLYENNVNVYAEVSKGNDSLQKVLYATENDFIIVTDNYNNGTTVFPKEFKSWYADCHVSPKNTLNTWGINRSLTDVVLQDKKDTHTRFHCEIWGPCFDGTKVEDKFVPLWKAFNTKFGHINDS